MAFTPRKDEPKEAPETAVNAGFDLALDGSRIMIYGQPKVGKTTAAASVSELWPGEIPSTQPVVLEDLFSIACDRNANIGLRSAGIAVPEFDIRKALQSGRARNIRDALKQAVEAAAVYVETKGAKTVIVDTVSMIDSDLNRYWATNMPVTERGEADKFAMYREILNSHANFWQDVDYLNARIVFLCHAAVNEEAVKPRQSDKDKAKLAVSSLAGTDIDIKPQLTGKASDLYFRNVDLILPMKLFGEAGSASCERKFLPYGGGGFTGGNRFHGLIDAEEPADLGALLRKIQTKAVKPA